MKTAVSFTDFSFRYPDAASDVFREVTFSLPEGSFALVAGATGAGKSTLLRAMNGLVPHFTGGDIGGRVEVEGRDTLSVPPRRLSDVVAFVPQDPSASFVLDVVEDEIAYALENLGVAPPKMRRRVEEVLDLLALEPLRARSVRTLSGGEQQRVAIAAALAPGPRLLLLDEPTSQLDPQGAEDVLAALQRLVHDLGMTVVVAEHRMERVAGFVDVGLGCVGGRVIMDDPAAVLRATETGPPVTHLGRALGWHPAPLTVREARRSAAELDLGPADERPATAAPPKLLKASGVEAGYGARRVLKGIDLEVGKGEIVALVGRNGAGKSTLLRSVAGLHPVDAGEIGIDGAPPEPGHNVALCPQTPESVLFRDSVRDEVETTLRWKNSDEDPDAYLAALDLQAFEGRHPRDLSAGQRLLVATAAMAATGAPLLLLDEPTRGLDPHSKDRLSRFIEMCAAEGKGVIFATHDVELVAGLAGRVVMLAGGEVISEGTPAEVIGDSAVFAPQMARVFGPEWMTTTQVLAAVGVP